MTKKKQAVAQTTVNPPRELDKLLVVGENTYNINAVHSDTAAQTVGKLVINVDRATDAIDFNGNNDVSISVVSPELGADFAAPITVPEYSNKSDIDSDSVLNFGDLQYYVSKLTGASWFKWDGDTLIPTTSNGTEQLLRMSVVTGLDGDSLAFNAQNRESQEQLPLFIYIATDTGKMYLGDSGLDTLIWLNKDADSANKLAAKRKLQVNLSSTNAVDFDGSSNASGNGNGIGVTGKLGIANGGTGASSAEGASYNLFKDIEKIDNDLEDTSLLTFEYAEPTEGKGVFFVRQASRLWNYILGKIKEKFKFSNDGVLPVTNGGTGATSAAAACTNLIQSQDINPNSIEIAGDGGWRAGVDLNNTNIIGVRSLLFINRGSSGDGYISFLSNSYDGENTKYDKLYSNNGTLYYNPKSLKTATDGAKTVYHSGMTIPVANGGTGQTDLANVTVGRATADAAGNELPKNYFKSAPCNANEQNKYSNSITISTTVPTTQGNNGDIWIVYK